jgi:PhzF family phenazine biosynthesis protein
MQKIAAENNLSETAFLIEKGDGFEIRWFTPTIEVALCGHATLAAAHVLFSHLDYAEKTIRFHSRHSGELTVSRNEDLITLNFPTDEITEAIAPKEVLDAFGTKPLAVFKGKTDFLLLYKNQSEIEACEPDHNLLKSSEARGIIVTAPGDEVDFVSRFFAPGSGIDEDPVTGSAHTTLTPFWCKKLNKVEMTARQLSQRGGSLQCKYLNDRVEISGHAVTYLTGEITIS